MHINPGLEVNLFTKQNILRIQDEVRACSGNICQRVEFLGLLHFALRGGVFDCDNRGSACLIVLLKRIGLYNGKRYA